jgi:aubergine-like protein
MENLKLINFLPNPHIKGKTLDYVKPVGVYANLFEMKFTKEIKMYQYPYEVIPEISKDNMKIRKELFIEPQRQLKAKYGLYLIDSDSMYSLEKVDDINVVKTSLRLKNEVNKYEIKINKYLNPTVINEKDAMKSEIQKHFIELIVKDILLANPNIERFKDTYIMLDRVETLNIDKFSSVNFYPGFRTSFVETDKGMFLNVVLTHKFIRNKTLLDYMKNFGDLKKKSIQEDINTELKGRSFKVDYAKRNYIIDEIDFDLNPVNKNLNYEDKTINHIEYYKKAYNIDIKNKDQPLIIVRKKDSKSIYFVPELCYLVGIDESDTTNKKFMKKVSECTKMDPTQKVLETNGFIQLLQDKTEDKKTHMSSKKKSDHYGIKITPLKDLFPAYYMKQPQLLDGTGQVFDKYNKEIKLDKNIINKVKWVLFYEDNYDENEKYLLKDFKDASGKYGIKLENPLKVKIPYGAEVDEWIREANKYFGEEKREYDFALFLLGENIYIYPQLKMHSLCHNGYISQVVKVDTLYNDKIKNICSNILIQINAKLGGSLYKIQIDKALAGKKLMVIGVDSSKHKDKNNYGTGIAMVATINDSLSNFYSESKIVKINDMKDQFHLCISNFIENALKVYEKNNNGKKPDWIIIYRQGVSKEQKEKLKPEIREIDETCSNQNIPYYYIFVNTKSTFKFFEKDKNGKYSNPQSGLLVLDGVINHNNFEFYIQPQYVNQGSATPTCFHVAYGNLNFPELIPKFTYDLCHLYSNWQGSVRIPHVMKCAEKLSKMTAKYKLNELNEKIKIGQAYL